MREPYSLDRFEWEPTGGISFPGAYGNTDFNNRGQAGIDGQRARNPGGRTTVETTDRFLYLNAGLWGQLGSFGIAMTADYLGYDVKPQNASDSTLSLSIVRMNAVAAYGFFNNQLCVGVGARMAYVAVDEVDRGGDPVISMFGVSAQGGLIVKPEEQPWRVGLTVRGPVSARPFTKLSEINIDPRPGSPDGTVIRRAGSEFILPSLLVLPWELEAGVAYQLGPRPLNPRWLDPREHRQSLLRGIEQRRWERSERHREEVATMSGETAEDRAVRTARIVEIAREEAQARAAEAAEMANADAVLEEERRARYLNWPREHVLLLASAVMTGASTEAVALEGFIDQRRDLVGRRVALAPRFAVESEAIPNLLKTRAGVYFEPSRFSDGAVRQHFTIGADVRLFAWTVFGLFPEHRQWRLSAFLDIAERYQNFGVGVGAWH